MPVKVGIGHIQEKDYVGYVNLFELREWNGKNVSL